jgi:hypothetical protein
VLERRNGTNICQECLLLPKMLLILQLLSVAAAIFGTILGLISTAVCLSGEVSSRNFQEMLLG